MKNHFIFLFILLIPSIVFSSEINTNEEDDVDDVVDISNLSVHIGGGVIFFIGLGFLIELINVYTSIGANALPPQSISTKISSPCEQYSNNRWNDHSLKFTID